MKTPETEKLKTQYPYQIASIVHKRKGEYTTLAFDARLSTPQEEDDKNEPSPPLEMHEGYSVYKGTLIIKKDEKNKEFLMFNIPAKSVPYIHKKTTMVMESNLSGMLSASGSESSEEKPEEKPEEKTESAYTVTMKTGTLKGKTPAQALMESSANVKKLENQINYLKKNLEKYPANQEQIDAMEQALELQKTGKLNRKSAGGAITIYETAPKNIKIPPQMKKMIPKGREDLWLIYTVTVTYDSSMNLPFNLQIMNCFAPVDKSKGNEIQMSEAIMPRDRFIRLSEEEWFNLIDRMKATKILFETSNFSKQVRLADKIYFENAKKDKE